MKICFIGQKGIPAVGGGVEQYVDNLATRLASQGHDVYVYTRWNYSNRAQKTYKGVRLVNLPTIPTKNLEAIFHTLLASIHVLFMRADVIHYHSIGPSSLLWLPKLFTRAAIVATFQSQCYLHKKWSLFAQAYLKFGEKVLCRLADTVIVPSRKLQCYAQDRYGRDALVIPNGVSLPKPQGTDHLAQWGLQPGEYILGVSRLVRHKGLHYAVKALKQLATDKKLVIVGDGAYTEEYHRELEALAASDDRVIMVGAQHGDALHQLFAHAALFVQPSESEGLSIALLEALSYGLPIVASDIAENKEAVGDAAALFPSMDVDALAKEMQAILEDDVRASQLRTAAYQRAAEQFNWDVLVDDVVDVYQNTVAHTALPTPAAERMAK